MAIYFVLLGRPEIHVTTLQGSERNHLVVKSALSCGHNDSARQCRGQLSRQRGPHKVMRHANGGRLKLQEIWSITLSTIVHRYQRTG